MMMWGKKEESDSESEEESIHSENTDAGPEISMIPAQLIDNACTINPSKPIGFRLTSEGWVEFVKEGSFASRSNVKVGSRVVRVETQRNWRFIESTKELKDALRKSAAFGDEQAVVVCSGCLRGEMKWQGAVKASNGKIYGIPANAREVLSIDPFQQIATTCGQLECFDDVYGDVENHWFGGVESKATSKVYAIPFNATQFLEINPINNTVKKVGTAIMGRNKWRGAVCDMYGRIHCIPSDSAEVCLFDPKINAWELYGELTSQGSNKWFGGCYCDHDDRILAIPFDATSVLIIDPEYKITSLVFEDDPLLKGSGKFSGGVMGPDGCIYCIPFNATFVLRIDPKARTLKKLDGELEGSGKWSGGVLGMDGLIYGIPYHADSVLRINPLTHEVSTVGSVRAAKGRMVLWRGGALGNDGNIYGIPADSPTVLKLHISQPMNDEEGL